MESSSRALLVAFLLVAAAFVGSTIWVQRTARSIDADTLLISRGVGPGIQALSALRAELRTLELAVNRSARTGDRAQTEQVEQARGRIDALMAQALALPNGPFESAKLGALQANLRAFDEAAERALGQARAGDLRAAQSTLDREARPKSEAAAILAKELVDHDAAVAEAAALRIETARERADRFAYQLDGLCALLALAAGFLALRTVRHSQRVQLENQRLIERKAEELEQFAGRVAHDVLSPLTAVGIALAIAGRTAPQAQGAIARGTSALSRVRGIVDGLLEFARAGARAEPGARADVAPVVAGLSDELLPFAAQHAATLLIERPPSCAVPCSPGVLLSLLGNLLRNAVKYLGEAQVREVSLRVLRRRGRVLFEVEDTGPGIPPSLTERVFEPYVRGPNSNVPGIGLGLATVKRLVVSHGGTVGVRPGARGGALFWFELDEAPAPQNAAAVAEEVHASLH